MRRRRNLQTAVGPIECLISAIPPYSRKPAKARWDWVESSSRFRSLIEHDLFGKPLHTFPDHALGIRKTNNCKNGGFGRPFSWSVGSTLDVTRKKGIINKLPERDSDRTALIVGLLHEEIDHVELRIDSNIGSAQTVPLQLADRTRLVRVAAAGAHSQSITVPEAVTWKVEEVVANPGPGTELVGG